ncbi:MAG: hypothetical protein HQL28_06480 [Candidatus Omnitrophica bacterium]|nr:hypothetical protein [Candidatus Omnitrophota bacterium]
MRTDPVFDKECKIWFADIKARVLSAQVKAALSVNTELLKLYWSIGADIVVRQKTAKWGDGFILRLSKDLTAEFPYMKGFSKRNLELIRQWFLFYDQIAKQLVSQLPLEPPQPQVLFSADKIC